MMESVGRFNALRPFRLEPLVVAVAQAEGPSLLKRAASRLAAGRYHG